MSHTAMSLNDLLQPNFKQAKRIGWQDSEKEAEIQHIRAVLEQEIPELDWDLVKHEIYQQLETLLDITLQAVLERAWITSKPVAQAIEKQLIHQSDAIVVIPLLPHKIRSKHQPSLHIHLNHKEVGQLPLVATYTFRLSGVLLKIKNGKIEMILAGKCKSFASLLYQDTMLKEQKTPTFDLPTINTNPKFVLPDETWESDDDIVSDQRNPISNPIKSVTIHSKETVASTAAIGFAKKIFFMMMGLAISLLVLAVLMFFLT